jgi:hypothetical protein
MPTSAEEYRAKASECAELAAKTNDPQSKRVLEQTAGQWTALANGVEKYGAKKKQKPCARERADSEDSLRAEDQDDPRGSM